LTVAPLTVASEATALPDVGHLDAGLLYRS